MWPFEGYMRLDWAPLLFGWVLRRRQTKFYCMKWYACYLLGRVRHQFTDEFCIPVPPPQDMKSKATTCVWALEENVAAMACRSRYTIRSISYAEYLDWFKQARKPHLFCEELWEW